MMQKATSFGLGFVFYIALLANIDSAVNLLYGYYEPLALNGHDNPIFVLAVAALTTVLLSASAQLFFYSFLGFAYIVHGSISKLVKGNKT